MVVPSPTESKSWIGERTDPEDGLTYLHARFYDPLLGRFLQPDWWDVTDASVGTNRYAYADGDPVDGSDADGHTDATTAASWFDIVTGRVTLFGEKVAGFFVSAPLSAVAIYFEFVGPTGGPCDDRISDICANKPQTFQNPGPLNAAQDTSDRGTTTDAAVLSPEAGSVAVVSSPPPNDGNGPPHGGDRHNQAIQDRLAKLRQDPNVRSVRGNQVQTDVFGNKVGLNRPDLQYDLFDPRTGVTTHYNVEFDFLEARSFAHRATIYANDPQSVIELNLLR